MSGKRPEISPYQLMILLLTARIMHTMIFRFDGFSSGLPIMLGLIITTAVEGVLCLPAVLYYSRGGRSVTDDLGRFSKPAKLLYSAYFCVIAGGTAALFAQFLQKEFSDSVSPEAAIILLGLVAAFCASHGIEALARASSVIFWLFAVMFVWMAAVNEGRFDFLNIRPLIGDDVKTMLSYALESLSSAWWIPMLCVLGEHLGRGAAGAAYGFLALKLLIIETLLVLITLVLWKYIGVLGYPIYALGAYAKSGFIQRFDAINMLVWAINCAAVFGVYVFISSKPMEGKKSAPLLAAAVSTAIALYELHRGLRYNEPWLLWFKGAGIAVLGIAFPLAAMIRKNSRKAEEK